MGGDAMRPSKNKQEDFVWTTIKRSNKSKPSHRNPSMIRRLAQTEALPEPQILSGMHCLMALIPLLVILYVLFAPKRTAAPERRTRFVTKNAPVRHVKTTNEL